MTMADLAARFWSKVDRSDGPMACWPWTASRFAFGYGRFSDRRRRGNVERSHRIAWELERGPIPTGLQVLHSCDNAPCCNPAHLWLGTNLDNMSDKALKGRTWDERGEANPRAKLKEADVLAIRSADLGQYGSLVGLARSLGVTTQTIREIRSRKRWPHLIGGQ
jgi:hypothetical protein